MTALNDQFTDITNRSQEAATTAVRSWTDSMQSFAGKMTTGQSQLPDLQGVVNQYFDFAETMLTKQREFAQQWASATASAFEGVTEKARSVATEAANSTEAVVDNAADTAVHIADETPQAPYAT